ncbi:MAG: 3-deoxy-8-phosphooctulonate synthase [Candidatus Omnitrophica bacterium]|nr:3-deoxy-8-phosphooctulonate synthase [Candidatus Omnitrophota bacterium]
MNSQTPQLVKVGDVQWGEAQALGLIAGPCVIEGEEHALRHARVLRELAGEFEVPFVFKSSYDKANRTSIHSYRGPGLVQGLKILRTVREEAGVPVLTDVHSPEEAEAAGEIVDVLQIPAFLCRQTDLLIAAARTGKVVNIKKGQFLAPWDMQTAIQKVVESGNPKVMVTERGASFGYNNLVSDPRSIAVLRRLGYPVVFDATHSVQLPGGQGTQSGGQREFVPTLARAAVAAGAHAVFMEVHEDPGAAPSDGPNMIPLDELRPLLRQLVDLSRLVRSWGDLR